MKFWFKCASVVLFSFITMSDVFAQLSGTGCIGQTSYTDGQPNDPIYYYPSGELGELTVIPEVAGASFNFVWSRFVPGNSNWSAFTVQNNVPTSTISGLQPGAYFVSVRNTSNVILGCYRAWIAQVLQEPQVDVQPILSNCVGPISLAGSFTPGQLTAISNLPESQLVIDANTVISVCFTGTHSWVSDLAFYLRGPASCGNPNLVLMPNPGGACNSTNNFTNFCFSTESTNNINVCSGVNGLSGTYGSYGAVPTPINWAPIYGCDAMNGGWAVQVYDCVGLDTGSLTDATITFTGTDLCGATQTVTYTTPAGFSSFIADNSCSAATASIYTVSPAVSPALLDCTFGFEWTSEPPITIPNATSSLTIDITSLTDLAGNPIPWQDIDFTLNTTINCDDLADQNDCFGGNGSDTETYVSIPQTQTTITDISPICIDNGTVQFTADVPGGTWSGVGVIDPATGVFDPMIAGEGSFTVEYTFADPCILPDNSQVSVEVEPSLTFNLPDNICEDALPFNLLSASSDGVFSGDGITDALLGTFDPAMAGVGTHTILMISNTVCPVNLSDAVNVNPIPTLVVSANMDVCPGEDVQISASGADSYLWSPSDFLTADNIADPIVSLGATTTYSVTATSSFGCEANGEVILTLLTSPTINVAPPALACPGAQVNLAATGSTGAWEWTLTDGSLLGSTQLLNIDFQVTTTVQAQVTDDCLNTATAQVVVSIESIPSVNAGLNAVLCDGLSTQLEVDVTGNYADVLWTTIDGVITGSALAPIIETSVEGTYTSTITTALGCQYSDDVFVDVVPLPTVSIVADADVCAGQPHPLSVNGALSYVWSPANGLSSSVVANPNATISAPATFTVTGTDGNGCVNTDQISLTIIASPQISASSVSMICPETDVVLSATGTTGSYSWSPATALNTDNGSTVIASPMSTTQYVVTLTDECGEQVQATVNVPVEQLYSVSAGNDTEFCEGLTVTLDANITGSNPTITWYDNSGLMSGENDDLLVVNSSGTYAVQVETPLGCIYDDAVVVNEVAYPTFYLADTLSYCSGESVVLNIPGSWDQVQWSNGSTGPQIEVSQEGAYEVTVYDGDCATTDEVHVYRVVLPQIELGSTIEICQGETAALSAGYSGDWSTGATADSILVATEGTYTFEYSEDGCSVMDEVAVVVNPLPFIDAVSTQYGCMNQLYTIVINDFAAGNYGWSDGSQEPYLEVDQPGDYWFMVTNECGSRAQTISVIFEDCDEAVYIPSCFTPDNDGINDVWQIVTRNINSMNATVFNRWGQLVFESNELSPVWTGGFNTGDTYVEDGLYFYRIEFERRDGQNELREGSMFIIR